MILSGNEIQKRLNEDIIIVVFNGEPLNANRYTLGLHNELLVYAAMLNMKSPNGAKSLLILKEGLVLEREQLYLGRTLDYTNDHRNGADARRPFIHRSSIGRLGLFVHVTAGFRDVGFAGYWALERLCVKPVRIYAGNEICQIFYHTIEGNYTHYESSTYQNNRGIQPSLLYRDFEDAKGAHGSGRKEYTYGISAV